MTGQKHNIKIGATYRHYKHDSNGPEGNFTYEIIGTGIHTESREELVVYRPLYKPASLGEHNYWIRPLTMFNEHVIVDGIERPRFTLISKN